MDHPGSWHVKWVPLGLVGVPLQDRQAPGGGGEPHAQGPTPRAPYSPQASMAPEDAVAWRAAVWSRTGSLLGPSLMAVRSLGVPRAGARPCVLLRIQALGCVS